MSEPTSRFRIKNGEIEIEYQGPTKEVAERYREAFGWLKSVPRDEGEKTPKKKNEIATDRKKGPRTSEIWSPAIDSLIHEGFFKLPKRRTKEEIAKALEDKALPVQGKNKMITQTLTRK